MTAFLQTGIIGILILIVSTALLVTSVVFLIVGNRKAILITTLLGVLPLLLGVAGTALGYAATNQTAGMLQELPVEVIEEGLRAARLTSWLGAGCTLALWLVALIGGMLSRMLRS